MKNNISIIICLLILLTAYATLVQAAPGDTILVSQSSSGNIGDDASVSPSISGDGRFVAFESFAQNLSPLDNNINKSDIFLKDLTTGEIKLLSRNVSTGKAGNNHSAKPSISTDGHFVAFESLATNFDPKCNNGFSQIFVHDLETQEISCVSVSSPALGGKQGNEGSYRPSISADGRYIAFSSQATKLVDGDNNDCSDIFVHDRESNETNLVSKGWDGTSANDFSYGAAISGNGRYIAFTSIATNLIKDYSNTPLDVFLFDQQTNTTRLVSVNTGGGLGNHNSEYPSLTYTGLQIVFESFANNLVSDDINDKKDIFLRDLTTGTTQMISFAADGSNADNHSYRAVISANGKYVSYESLARNLVSSPVNPIRDIFIHEIQTGKNMLVSVSSDGSLSTHDSISACISKDGKYVAFSSEASNFADIDDNGVADIFRHENQIINVRAGFLGAPTSGYAPLQVLFTNQSLGDFIDCEWDFGDGNASDNCDDPSHTYQSAGIYSVTLTVRGPGGTDTRTNKEYITVNESPPVQAEFKAAPTSGYAPLSVHFTNQSTGEFVDCKWDFGDGNSSNNCDDPSHNYQSASIYSVTLTVTGPGVTDTRTRLDYITVLDVVDLGYKTFMPLIQR